MNKCAYQLHTSTQKHRFWGGLAYIYIYIIFCLVPSLTDRYPELFMVLVAYRRSMEVHSFHGDRSGSAMTRSYRNQVPVSKVQSIQGPCMTLSGSDRSRVLLLGHWAAGSTQSPTVPTCEWQSTQIESRITSVPYFNLVGSSRSFQQRKEIFQDPPPSPQFEEKETSESPIH